MAVKDYDPGAVTLTWGGLLITGFAAGSMISVELPDAFTKSVGAQGDVTRVRSRNRTARLTLRLLQTSPANDLLSQRFIEDQRGLPHKEALLLKDELGTTAVSAENAWIAKGPNAEFGDTDTPREWILDTGETLPFIGGNIV